MTVISIYIRIVVGLCGVAYSLYDLNEGNPIGAVTLLLSVLLIGQALDKLD